MSFTVLLKTKLKVSVLNTGKIAELSLFLEYC